MEFKKFPEKYTKSKIKLITIEIEILFDLQF